MSEGPREASPDAGLRAATALGEAGNARASVAVLERLLARHPDHAAAHALLGLYLLRLGRREAALSACRSALALDPRDAEAHRMLGHALSVRVFGLGRAHGHFLEAVALDPESGLNHLSLAGCLARLGRPRQAWASFERALDLAPAHPGVLVAAAEFLFDGHRRDEARTLAARALAAAPEDPRALATAARARLIDRRLAEARDLARAALARHATSRAALAVLVEVDMCRNPLFALWSRQKSWRRGGAWRGPCLFVGVWYAAAIVLVGLVAAVPSAGRLALAAFGLLAAAALWPGLVLRWRIGRAGRSVRLKPF